MNEEKEQFTGEKLKELRRKYGMTQKELAKKIGVVYSKVSEWETGRYQSISNAYQRILKDFFDKIENKE